MQAHGVCAPMRPSARHGRGRNEQPPRHTAQNPPPGLWADHTLTNSLECGSCQVWRQDRAQRSGNAHYKEPTCCHSLGNGLDDLGGGVLDVCEEALSAPPQDVQEPAVGLVVLSKCQA